MSDYDESWLWLADEHFASRGYRATPMSEDEFFRLVDAIDLPSSGYDEAAERALAILDLEGALAARARLTRLAEPLVARARAAYPELDRQSLADAAYDVIAEGREALGRALRDPSAVADRARSRSGLEFESLLAAYPWLEHASDAEIERALRRGSRVLPFADHVGWLDKRDLVDHPEHGLGFVVVDWETPTVSVVFRAGAFVRDRHAWPERSITLHREGPDGLEHWYAGLGAVGEGLADLLESEGPPGSFERVRYLSARPRAEVVAELEASIARRRKMGFSDAKPASTRLVVRLEGTGLVAAPSIRERAIEALARLVRETGLGEYVKRRVARDDTHLFFDVVGPVEAARRAFPLGRFEGLGARSRVWIDEPELATPPCLLHEDLPYFGKLAITPDGATSEEAEEQAEHAIAWARAHGVELDGTPSSFDALDRLLAIAEDAETAATHVGSYAGEVLRHATGGSWGVGTLYRSPIPFGLLLGRNRVKCWPIREAREVLDGTRAGAFSARCRWLLSRANAELPTLVPEDRLFPLAAGEGRFDAGVTADGRQALMGTCATHAFAFFFDGEGRLLEHATRPELELDGWQRELGLSPRTIRVRRFSSRDEGVGIDDLPWHLAELLHDPSAEGDPEGAEARVRSWIESGMFVLYWGNDLTIDADGHVVAS